VFADKKLISAAAKREMTVFITRVTVASSQPVHQEIKTASDAVDDRTSFGSR
jgi:hypothetical protein